MMAMIGKVMMAGVVLGMAGCAASDPFEQTELGRTRVMVSQSVTVHDTITQPDRDFSMAGQLGDAAFVMTRCLDRAQAENRLEADGANCDATTCRWTSRLKEPPFPCGVPPVSLVSMCIRPAGPRRTFEVEREITFLSPRVGGRKDILAAVRSRVVDGTPDRRRGLPDCRARW
jgi:hypothetical protein